MGLTRRAFLAGAIFVGVAGCSSDDNTSNGGSGRRNRMTNRISRYFNDDDELTADVDNQSTTSDEVSIGDGEPTTSHTTDEARFRYDDNEQGPRAVYERNGGGQLSNQLRHTQQVVGSRFMGQAWPLPPHSSANASDWSYSHTGGRQVIQRVRYSFLEQPPNMIPVLRVMPSMAAENSGETFVLDFSIAGNSLLTVEAPKTEFDTYYAETYLHEEPFGSGDRGENTLASNITVTAGVDSASSAGTVGGASGFALDWEVV